MAAVVPEVRSTSLCIPFVSPPFAMLLPFIILCFFHVLSAAARGRDGEGADFHLDHPWLTGPSPHSQTDIEI
jgi:hypothetical protein